MNRFSIPTIILLLLIFVSCSSQKSTKEHSETTTENVDSELTKKKEPHRYGGWYCPDNFGFVPIDIQKIDEVPAIADRLPTEQELNDKKSLISVDTDKYPDARAFEMKLPRVARINSNRTGMDELIIVIQAIIVSEDTVVGYRFPNGGNGSAWLSDVEFLSEEELAGLGSQPFFYSKSILKASKEDIWKAFTKTNYFKELGEKFDKKEFFSSEWTSHSEAHLKSKQDGEKATGYVGTVFGNAYLHIDYHREGSHYSEKLLMSENREENTTELYFASGPFPKDFEKQRSNWNNWIEEVKKMSAGD